MTQSSSPAVEVQYIPFLDTVEGEIALFKGVAHARPVGIHKHFHMLGILLSIKQETGRIVGPEEVWEKLATLYNLEALEDLELSGEELDETEAPPPTVNYHSHKCFEKEYELPHQQFYPLIVARASEQPRGHQRADSDVGSVLEGLRRSSGDFTHHRKGSASTSVMSPSKATPAPASTSAAMDIGGFDSEGELTEEEDGGATGDGASTATGTGGTTGKGKRRRSRSVRTPRSEAAGSSVAAAGDKPTENEDVEMATGDEEVAAAVSPGGSWHKCNISSKS
ncbi:hypothetical protein FRB99_005801 [Tulasnella sp. 403]|nr:hypothetical protein FRB99_005801 [Tulasnella sp. 403]